MTPLVVVYLRAVGRLNRRASHAQRTALEMRLQRDDALELVTDLRDDVAALEGECAGWRRRAEALFDAMDPAVASSILGVIDTIERLPEVEAGHGN